MEPLLQTVLKSGASQEEGIGTIRLGLLPQWSLKYRWFGGGKNGAGLRHSLAKSEVRRIYRKDWLIVRACPTSAWAWLSIFIAEWDGHKTAARVRGGLRDGERKANTCLTCMLKSTNHPITKWQILEP